MNEQHAVEVAQLREALDYLVSQAIGSDYADAMRVHDAEWLIEDALGLLRNSPGQRHGGRMTFMTSWPGGESAWDTEAEAQAEAQRKVREGIPHCVVWEHNNEGDE